ncbi:helix-turn-helix domain-containing protein [Microbacterium sp. NPDC057650]|uniref:helix-turn-helix domain-containing protein n=1 Tax=unclassified Microbacterium TaxID=2609290 RepID=UPI00366D3472
MSIAIDDRRRPTFGLRHRLVLAREVAELDQSALAEALGVSRQTVSNYERGFTAPRRAVLLAWAMATAVDADWLLTGNDETPPTGDGVSGQLPRLDSNQQPAD